MMNITVLPIILADAVPNAPLSKVMNDRLRRLADELRLALESKLKDLEVDAEELVIYMSYNGNYAIRWKVVNDVPTVVEDAVTKYCSSLNYLIWKGSPIYVPNSSKLNP
jgi:hypothetical protein